MVKVKICANKSIEDAKMCIDAKADIIGILVDQEHSSNDFVDKEVAIKIVNPYGVDVNSGCKNELGIKDKEKVESFINNSKLVII